MPATFQKQQGVCGPWQTYADEMAMLGHGIALWQPAPLHNYNRVNIGDVGYIRKGRFHLLFSAAQPLGNREPGVDVPRDFVPIDPGPTVKDQPRVPGALHTQHIQQKGADIGAFSDITCIGIGTKLCFETSSRKGAILLTKYKTFCEDAKREGFFKEYMLRHQQSWVDYANQLGHMVNLDDILLVTGHDMTLDFAMLAFSSNFRQIGMEFEAGLPGVASASASVWGMWRTSTAVHRNCGPQHREPPTSQFRSLSIDGADHTDDLPSEYNQCVFIRGFRIRKRARLIPIVIRAAAGVHDLGPGKRDDEEGPSLPREPGENTELDVDAVSNTPPFVDPLDPIFRYIFEHSTADTAIVHDVDLSKLLKVSVPGANDIYALLSPHMIEISDGIACINPLLRGADIPKREKLPSHPLLKFHREISQSSRPLYNRISKHGAVLPTKSTIPPQHVEGKASSALQPMGSPIPSDRVEYRPATFQALYPARHDLSISSSPTEILRSLDLSDGDYDPRTKYKCSECGKRFDRPSELDQHRLGHTGERPFSCPVQGCNSTFKIRFNLARHVRTQHDRELEDIGPSHVGRKAEDAGPSHVEKGPE